MIPVGSLSTPKNLARLLTSLILLILVGCVGVPTDYPKEHSVASTATADTTLGALSLEWTQNHGRQSGFLGLPNGTEVYEIKADEVGDWEGREGHPELLTLHTKAAIIDRETVFIGSLNFDPRSLDINSEMGLFITSDTVGAEVYDMVSESMGGVTYRVIVNDKDQLRWVFDHQDNHEVLDKEPLTTWGRRFSAGFYGILPIEGQL